VVKTECYLQHQPLQLQVRKIVNNILLSWEIFRQIKSFLYFSSFGNSHSNEFFSSRSSNSNEYGTKQQSAKSGFGISVWMSSLFWLCITSNPPVSCWSSCMFILSTQIDVLSDVSGSAWRQYSVIPFPYNFWRFICNICFAFFRNLAMEKVASTVMFPCRYQSSGCSLSLLHTDKTDHEETCEFRPYSCPCPGASCKWQGSLEQVMQHLMQAHKSITTLQGEDIVFLATDINLPGAVDWVMMQSCFGHHFM